MREEEERSRKFVSDRFAPPKRRDTELNRVRKEQEKSILIKIN